MYSKVDLIRLLYSNPDLSVEGGENMLSSKPKVQESKISEHDLQTAVIAECNHRSLTNPLWGLIFAVPNGGHRHPVVAAKLKAEGVKAGVLDLTIPVARHGYHGCFVELKVGDNKPSQPQLDWIRHLTAEGYLCRVFWDSVDEVVGFIEWYLERK